MLFHPSDAALDEFDSGTLRGARAERLTSHLAECARCRSRLRFAREVREAARVSPAPEPRPGTWDRIAERRAAGERVLVAADWAAAPARVRRLSFSGAAAAVTLIVFVAALGVEGVLVASQRGKLTITPLHPAPGSTITFRYQPASGLRSAGAVVVRARYVGVREELWYAVRGRLPGLAVSTLRPAGDGSFTGSARLPDSAVYALFSVEDPQGAVVDANGGLLWDVVAAGPDGRASFDGLRARAARGRPSARALEAADSLVAFYADSAQSWAIQTDVQGASRIPHWLRVFDERERRYARLDAALSGRASLSAAEVAAMVDLAAQVEDSAGAAHWRARLLAEHPDDILAIEARTAPGSAALTPAEGKSSLAAMERLWRRMPGDDVLINLGITVALPSGDSAAVRIWSERYAVRYGRGVPTVHDPAARAGAKEGLEARLTRLRSDSIDERSLLSTRQRDLLYRRGLIADALGALGAIQIADGDTANGRASIRDARELSRGFCGFAWLDSIPGAEPMPSKSAAGKCSREWAMP